jgi:hypothetical protein
MLWDENKAMAVVSITAAILWVLLLAFLHASSSF